MRITVYVDDKKFKVPAERAEDATEAAWNVHEEVKKQLHVRSLRLSFGRRR